MSVNMNGNWAHVVKTDNESNVFLSDHYAELLSFGYFRASALQKRHNMPSELCTLCSLLFNEFLNIDDVVMTNFGVGVVKYHDTAHPNQQTIGLVMDEPADNYGSDGMKDGVKYFDMPNTKRTLFVGRKDIVRCVYAKPVIKSTFAGIDQVKIGDRVRLTTMHPTYGTAMHGVVKYNGYTEFVWSRRKEKLIGLEILRWIVNNASSAEEYFSSNPGRRYFINASVIDCVLKPQQSISADNTVHERAKFDFEPKLGDRVVTDNGLSGVVRYFNVVHFAEEQVCGLELDSFDANANNAVIHGHRYFDCGAYKGYFICRANVQQYFEKDNAYNIKKLN